MSLLLYLKRIVKVGGGVTDWNKIKNEYIHGNISYRELAEKHGVGFSALTKVALKEKWFEKRKQQRNIIDKKVVEKTAEKIATKEADRIMRISKAADRLLEKIELATEQLDLFIVENKAKERTIEYEKGKAGFGKPKKETVKEATDKRIVKKDVLDRQGLKQLTSALKDLRDIQFVTDENKNSEEEQGINITVIAATPDNIKKDDLE